MASVYEQEQKKKQDAQQYQQIVNNSAQTPAGQSTAAAGQSPTIAAANQYLGTQTGRTGGGYTGRYRMQMDNLLSQILGRGPFRYNAATDPSFGAYRDMYMMDGRRAMQDTMGQAAALTGGYGNSYAQSAGQQAYNQYMERLYSLAPQFQQQAYQQYKDEGDMMAQNLQLLAKLDEQEYGRGGGSGGNNGGGDNQTGDNQQPDSNGGQITEAELKNANNFIATLYTGHEFARRGSGGYENYQQYLTDAIEKAYLDGKLTGNEAKAVIDYYNKNGVTRGTTTR